MDYIVMDLEWNQNPYGKNNNHPDIPFEIIEIGAVKVNDDLEVVDEFQQVVKPRVYKRLHYKIQEITHLTMEELNSGEDFRKVIRNFLNWCGDDYIFCTWGSMDLTELQKNMKHYGMERILEFPLFYVDLQKMYSLCYEDGHIKRTLSYAVEELNIKEDEQFHRAICDAEYTAKVMKAMDFDKVKEMLSIDTFYSPRIKEEEVFVRFPNYTKYISREFLSKDEMFFDRDVSSMKCNVCDKPLKVLIDWFSDSGKMYYCLGECQEHGYVRGKIKVKPREEDSFFVVKIMRSTDEEGAESIREKQESIKEKRRERRQKSLDSEIVIEEIWDEDEIKSELDDK